MQKLFSRRLKTACGKLLGVELDDELFLHRQCKVFANREAFNLTFEFLFFYGYPGRQSSAHNRIQRINYRLNLATLFRHFNHVADIHEITWNVDALAIHQKVIVPDKVASLSTGIRETKAINDIVQPSLKRDQQIRTGDPFFTVRFFKEKSELFLGKPVGIFYFLLFTELNTVIRWFSAPSLPVFTRRISSTIKGAFV